MACFFTIVRMTVSASDAKSMAPVAATGAAEA
jgi:hypothetical protein